MSWLKKRWHDIANIEDSVKSNLSNLDDTRRDNPLLSAMIPFTPENMALMVGSGALLGGGMALSGGLGALGAGSAAAGGAGAAGGSALASGAGAAGGLGLGNTLMGLGSIGAGIYGANQSKKGVDAQIAAGDRAALLEKESADKQLELQRQIWEKQQADYKPYLEQGTWGINRLGDLMKQGSGQLNNPFDSYLKSKGVTDNFDSYLKSKGVSDNFDSYLKSKGITDNFDSYLKSKGLAGGQFDTNNPAYQFQLKQGQQALDRQNAARGAGFSGSQMKAAQQFGQGLASQEYDKQYTRANEAFTNDYNRASGQFTNNYNRANDAFTNDYNRANGQFTDYYNRLAGVATGGQQAAGSMAQAGSQYANNASNTFGNLSNAQTGILGQQANARASGYTANANALNGTLNSLTNLYGMSKWGK
jgi:hypothetical protein